MARVKKIQVINGQGSLCIVEGQDGVDRIEDKSMEYEDSLYSMYLCYDKNNRLVKSIENCPVVVDYYTEEDLNNYSDDEEEKVCGSCLNKDREISNLNKKIEKLKDTLSDINKRRHCCVSVVPGITKDKEYKILAEEGKKYCIVDDTGELGIYSKTFFDLY